ncbi:hypothetical protein PIB30_098951 [Stylosanthes scabra]|uniref:Uncharacterized protein n=1 Tax=Stylosanthes scabra TaxID=79078 RepID=A0ABU6UZB7_9FABA|nr:hypothetical protein [Stylosanthes scabra]
MKAKVKHLKDQLKTIKIQGSTSQYIAKIKITQCVSALGAPLTSEEFVEDVGHGLNEDYGPFIATINSGADEIKERGDQHQRLKAQIRIIVSISRIIKIEAQIRDLEADLEDKAISEEEGSTMASIGHNASYVESFDTRPQAGQQAQARLAAPLPKTPLTEKSSYLDTGALHHLNFDANNLVIGSEYEGTEQVFTGCNTSPGSGKNTSYDYQRYVRKSQAKSSCSL